MGTAAREAQGWAPSRPALRAGLAAAEERTLAEVQLVRECLRRAVRAATTQDRELANEVSAIAAEFGERYGEVHDMLLGLVARQTPVAGDLRLAMALLHVNDRAE